jgi:branched-chain amino acid transport system ATP-binding protein
MVPAERYAVEARRVSLAFGGIRALSNVDLAVRYGEAIGLVGPNGSGKTTLLNIVSGIYRPDSGQILVDGSDLTGRPPHRIAPLGIGRTFQHPDLPKEMRVIDAVMLGRHRLIEAGGIAYSLGFAALRGIERRHHGKAMESLDLVGLAHLARRTIGELPYGLTKRVDLARALAAEPRVLLLDEPVAGLNDLERGVIGELLLEVMERLSLTFVIVEHSMSWVARMCSRVVVLSYGLKIYEGSVTGLATNAAVAEALLDSKLIRDLAMHATDSSLPTLNHSARSGGDE